MPWRATPCPYDESNRTLTNPAALTFPLMSTRGLAPPTRHGLPVLVISNRPSDPIRFQSDYSRQAHVSPRQFSADNPPQPNSFPTHDDVSSQPLPGADPSPAKPVRLPASCQSQTPPPRQAKSSQNFSSPSDMPRHASPLRFDYPSRPLPRPVSSPRVSSSQCDSSYLVNSSPCLVPPARHFQS